MPRILVILLGAGLLAMASPAEAAVTGDWGAYSVLASRFQTPLPNAYVHRSACPDDGASVCANPSTNEAWIPAYDLDRFTLAHELGHLFDGQYLTDRDREWLRRVMRAPSGDWWEPWGAGEWFADYYADCATDAFRHRTSEEGYADRPSRRRLSRVCTAIWAWGLTRP